MKRPGAPAVFAWKVITIALAKGYATRPTITRTAGKRKRYPSVRSWFRRRWTFGPQPTPRRDDGRGRLTVVVVDMAIVRVLRSGVAERVSNECTLITNIATRRK